MLGGGCRALNWIARGDADADADEGEGLAS